MAITTYAQLQAAIPDWMDRADLTTTKVQEFISLAEAHFNRELKMVETDTTLTGVAGSRRITINSLDIIDPIALMLVDGTEERPLVQRMDGSFPYTTNSTTPSTWAIDGDNIDFDCLLDTAYSFRFRYVGKFALSDASPTNKLLEDHPDVYLAGALVWSGLFVEDDGKAGKWNQILDNFIRAAKHRLAQSRRGKMTADAGILLNNRPAFYGW